jgi:hypothetical protein
MSPRTAESNAMANIMGINDPVPFNQAECDAKIAKVVKEAAARNTKTRAERDEKTGYFKPEAIHHRRKIELFRLREIAKNAEIRLNEYGVPDCRLAQERIDAALAARKVAAENGSLNEERRQELLLQQHENELVQAQQRLEKFRKENNTAVRLLREFEQSWVAQT